MSINPLRQKLLYLALGSGLIVAVFGCKPKESASGVKDIVGLDLNGVKHAMSFVPVKNYTVTNLDSLNLNSEGATYARDLVDTHLFALVDCIDLPHQKAEAAIKNMEVEAAIGNVYVDKFRTLWRRSISSGQVDEHLPCSIAGNRLLSVRVLNDLLDKPYKAGSTPEDLRLSQAVYLALRGNTVTDKATISAPMSAYITAVKLHTGLGNIQTKAMLSIIHKYDLDLNPCITQVGKFGKAKFSAYTCVAAEGSSTAKNYQPKTSVGNFKAYRDQLGTLLSKAHTDIYSYSEAAADGVDVMWDLLTSTKPWSLRLGKGSSLGKFLAGTPVSNFNFASFFRSSLTPSSGIVAGLGLADDNQQVGLNLGASYSAAARKSALPRYAGGASKVQAPGGRGRPGRPGTRPGTTPPPNPAGATPPDRTSTGPALSNEQANSLLTAQIASLDKQYYANKASDPNVTDNNRGFAAAVERQMLLDKQATLKAVQQQIVAGQLIAENGGRAEENGNVRYKDKVTSATVFMRPDSAGTGATVAVWEKSTGSTPGTAEWFNKDLGNPRTGGAGVAQSVVVDAAGKAVLDAGGKPQRDVLIGFAGDNDNSIARGPNALGVFDFKATTNAKGEIIINCKDGENAKTLASAVTKYNETQKGLFDRATQINGQLGGGTGTEVSQQLTDLRNQRQQIQTDFDRNKAAFQELQKMTTGCGSAALMLADDGCPLNNIQNIDLQKPPEAAESSAASAASSTTTGQASEGAATGESGGTGTSEATSQPQEPQAGSTEAEPAVEEPAVEEPAIAEPAVPDPPPEEPTAGTPAQGE